MAEEIINEVLGIEETVTESPKKQGIFDNVPETETNSESQSKPTKTR